MKIIQHRKLEFKKGEKYHLDELYTVMGLLPVDDERPYYQQDDINDLARYSASKSRDGSENDCGEYVKILRNFSLEIKVKG